MQEYDQKMKIFLDTANLESIKKYNDMGAIDGITTNPSLLSKEKGNPARIMNEIVRIVKGPVSLDILGKMLMHPLTEKGLAAFLSDWEKLKKENSSLII